jgi:hypothetical protein
MIILEKEKRRMKVMQQPPQLLNMKMKQRMKVMQPSQLSNIKMKRVR